MLQLVFHLQLLCLIKSCTGAIQILQYSNYTNVWISADKKISFWRPEPPPGYIALGDVAVTGTSAPLTSTIFVKEHNQSGSLAAPLRYYLVWSDERSVTVFQPVAPYGYQCLGMIASTSQNPIDFTRYSCVKDEHLIKGSSKQMWSDSSALYKRSYVMVTLSEPNTGGLPSNYFYVTDNPYSSVISWVIHEHGIQFTALYSIAQVTDNSLLRVKLASGDQLVKMWQPLNSDMRIYNINISRSDRAGGYHMFGSVLVKSIKVEDMWLVTGELGSSLQYPKNYTLVWSQTHPISIYLWQPHCNPLYINFGLFATDSEDQPTNDSTVCVHNSMVSLHHQYWSYVWSDPTYQNSLWLSSVKKDKPAGSFTHVSGMTYPKTWKPYYLKSNKIHSHQTHLVGYLLEDLRILDEFRFSTQSDLYHSETIQNPSPLVQLDVSTSSTPETTYTVLCTVQTLLIDDHVTLRISPSPLPADLDRNVADIVQFLFPKIAVLNQYTKHSVKRPSKINLSPGQKIRYAIYHKTYWMDMPFSAQLYKKWSGHEKASYESTIPGNLNIVVDTYELEMTDIS